jgi:polysaccharide biosynthesis/export protein
VIVGTVLFLLTVGLQAPGAEPQQQPAPAPAQPAPAQPAPAQPAPAQPAPAPQPAAPVPAPGPQTPAVVVPAGYVIGPEDVLTVVVWREKDLSLDVTVRPDGRVTLPLINDVVAQGLTPEQLRDEIKTQVSKFVEDPSVTVTVKQINSRRVYITGMVGKAGAYPLTASTTVVQLIALAGGLQEFADSKNIIIMRTENGKPTALRFNYKEVLNRKNLRQNVELRPGDTVVVP